VTYQEEEHYKNVTYLLKKEIRNEAFDDTKFRLNNADVDFLNEFERKRETRYFTLSFRYNFGSENTSKKPKIEKPEPREGGGEGGM
jgi:hypothetical protein